MLFLSLVLSLSANATPPSHEATPAEIQRALENNSRFHARLPDPAASRPFRPVEDTAAFEYVLMSGYTQDTEEVAALRETIARNLPASVKLILLVDAADVESTRATFSRWIDPSRLILATDPTADLGFWARDSFPIPVYDDEAKNASLVAANYYREFAGWSAIAGAAKAKMVRKDFTFVGGNLLSDEEGNCFSVDSYRLFTSTEADLRESYGCRNWHLMKHVRGLGDADEVLKPLGGKRMLTNSSEYKAELESWGYSVVLLPVGPEEYRTYTNSLVVGNVVFMPSYGVALDAQAQKVYEGLGFKVFPIRSNQLSDEEHGSVHCQTMAYPKMPSAKLLSGLGLKELL